MAVPFRQLQIRRGLKSNLPTGVDGEPLFCEDTGELFVGSTTGNKKVNAGYTPATPSNWATPRPTTIQEAIDRIAAAVEILSGGPIA